MLKDIQQEKEVGECEQCGGDFYKGYEVYRYDNTLFCDEYCVKDYVMAGEVETVEL
jgi:hypothetical protein